jgi:hypothetical protein
MEVRVGFGSARLLVVRRSSFVTFLEVTVGGAVILSPVLIVTKLAAPGRLLGVLVKGRPSFRGVRSSSVGQPLRITSPVALLIGICTPTIVGVKSTARAVRMARTVAGRP